VDVDVAPAQIGLVDDGDRALVIAGHIGIESTRPGDRAARRA